MSTKFSGPVIGAMVTFRGTMPAIANSETDFLRFDLPAGATFLVTDISVFCGTVTSDPLLTVGVTAAGAEVVASVALATGLNTATIVDGVVAASEFIDVRIVADAGDAITLVQHVAVTGYYTGFPTSAGNRGRA